MVALPKNRQPENDFRNCKNTEPDVKLIPSSAEATVPICAGRSLPVSQYKQYLCDSDAHQRLARVPKGVKTPEGSLSPDDLDGRTPSQVLDKGAAELDRMTDTFFVFYRVLGLVSQSGKFTEAPWHARTRDEFLGRYVRTYSGAPSPRKARMYIQAANTYLEMALDLQEGRTKTEPPQSISALVRLSQLPPSHRCSVLSEAIRTANGSHLGPVLQQKVMALKAAQSTCSKKPKRKENASKSADQPNPTPVWKALDEQTRGLPLEQKVQFFGRLTATFEARLREGLDPFRPVPKSLAASLGWALS